VNQASQDPLSYCGLVEESVEYVGVPELIRLANLTTADACCSRCQERLDCRAWTWGRQLVEGLEAPGVCSLKHLEPMQMPTKVPVASLVSGMPFRLNQPGSLFCFALAQPESYEVGLLQLQHKERVSLFDCDEFAVYSSREFEVAPGVNASPVDSDLHCRVGGEFKTALNTDIFMAVWAKVIQEGRFRYHDWTVKVDPDSVFFPLRLRIAVTFHQDPGDGIYLNNCKFGLHGPIEVFSRRAVERWAEGSARCTEHFSRLCSGPCKWGEDMFIDQCLWKVLKVRRVDDWNLLSEPHCDSGDWQDCDNGGIAFHPFKNASGYRRCLANAHYGALPRS